jgi:hypothetical protein
MIKGYYYNKQIKTAVMAFANIFAGLTVRTGLNGCGEVDEIEVPIRYGSTDRVASAIASGNTQNAQHTLPIMACYMTGMNLAPERMHGVNGEDRRTYMEQGGVYPQDIKVIRRVMPIPYNLQMELSIYASNTDQAYQIIEQILVLFDYDLQLQFNDAPFDWAKITKLTLTSIQNEEVYPVGTDRRVLVWNMEFDFPIWISPPMERGQGQVVKQMVINVGDIDDYHFAEVDENGNLVPFSPINQTTTLVQPPSSVDSPEPGKTIVNTTVGTHYDPSLEACRNESHNPRPTSL